MPRKPMKEEDRKYQRVDPEVLAKAISLIQDDGWSISVAARERDIARKTLSGKVNEKHTKDPGHPTVLDKQQEEALVNFMAARAFPLSIALVKSFAWQIAKKSDKDRAFNLDDGPGKTWWHSFYKRHKDKITLRKSDKLGRGGGQTHG